MRCFSLKQHREKKVLLRLGAEAGAKLVCAAGQETHNWGNVRETAQFGGLCRGDLPV